MDGVNPRCVFDELSNTQELSHHTNAEVLDLKRKLDDVSTELADTKMIFRDDTKSTTTSMQYNQ
eukprot:1524084-Ditylum_brightwellii.AAC.1